LYVHVSVNKPLEQIVLLTSSVFLYGIRACVSIQVKIMSSLSLNVGNFITLKLSPNNYPLWQEQALALAESQDLVGHLTNEDPTPIQYITPDGSNITPGEKLEPKLTEAFIAWRKADRLLRGWIIGTLSEETLSLVVGLDTAYAIWEAFKNAYAQDSQEREFTLRQQVTYFS
jgi:hypothetical protein